MSGNGNGFYQPRSMSPRERALLERTAVEEAARKYAKANYSKGEYFIWQDEVYLAMQAIPEGAEIQPGKNCVKKELSDIMNGGN